jgi:hypothetical protein
LLIDTVAADLTLNQNSGVKIATDFANYFTERGSGGAAVTFGTDIAAVDATHQKVIGLNQVPLDTTVTPTDGMTWQYNASSGKWVPVFDRATRPVSAVAGKPSAAQLVLIYTAEAAEIFPANFSSPNSYGSAGVNPTATAVYSIYKNGSTVVGTVSVATSGVFTFVTTGGATFTLNAGDRLTMVAPGSQDATMADVGITLVGTRGAVSSAVAPPPIFTWRGAYSGGTTYNPFDVVSSGGSSYVCILASTGNAPPNATYWNVLAAAGAAGTNGTVTPAQVQQEAVTAATDIGTANAYAITLSPAPTIGAYSRVQLIAANANSGASTVTVNSTTYAIKKQVSVALALGDILAGQMLDLMFDGTNFQMPSGGAVTSLTTTGSSGAATLTAGVLNIPTPGTSAVVLLESHTASSSASLNFTSWYSSSYDEYVIEIVKLVPVTNAVSVLMRMSTNGGSTYDSGSNYGYASWRWIPGGSTQSGSDSTTSIVVDGGAGTDVLTNTTANGGLTGTAKLFDPGSATANKLLTIQTSFFNTASHIEGATTSAWYKITTAVNAFQILMSSGNISSGIVRVYGVSH